jgi:riboflavin kinase/FMN adenylyltransferase
MLKVAIDSPPTHPQVVIVGNFDGVHRGHQALVAQAHLRRRELGSSNQSVGLSVVSFEPHPVEFLKPDVTVARLDSPESKVKRLRNLGVDKVVVLAFNEALSKLSARDFFEQVLVAGMRAKALVVGSNFYFGQGREGTPERLKSWCQDQNIVCDVVAGLESDGEMISSSRIRKLLLQGQVSTAARLLGRDYELSGPVEHGDKRGRTLGFPTANLVFQTSGHGARCLPQNGVYATVASVEGKTFPAVTNVGVRPTFKSGDLRLVETHLLLNPTQTVGADELYGKFMSVEFRDRLREERKFSSMDELREQIQRDATRARAALSSF